MCDSRISDTGGSLSELQEMPPFLPDPVSRQGRTLPAALRAYSGVISPFSDAVFKPLVCAHLRVMQPERFVLITAAMTGLQWPSDHHQIAVAHDAGVADITYTLPYGVACGLLGLSEIQAFRIALVADAATL